MSESVHNLRAVGANPARADGPAKVDGSALYVDDLVLEGMWFGATVRCPHARARLVSIDASALDELEDVVLVTASDVPGGNVLTLIEADWPVLVDELAEHVGEAACLVAAPTRDRARRAAAAIRIHWEPLEAACDLDAALAGDPRVLASCAMDHGDVEAAFAQAGRVVEGVYETGHQEHVYIEPQGILATATEDSLEFIGSLQCPYYVHKAMCTLFGLSGDEVRVRQAVTGGGFGGKEDFPDMLAAHAALLSRKCGRPVKLVYDRHEDIVATTKRHPSRIRHKTAVAADGSLLAMEIDVLFDGGAYTTLSPVVLSRGVIHAAGAYRCPNVRVRGRVLATNTATNGAFRGFGAPQTQYAVERHMDAIARELGMDPLTLRLHNAYREGDVTPTGQVLSESVSALECLEKAEELTSFRQRWTEYEGARANDGGSPRRGIGLSLSWHGTGFTGNGERVMRSPVTIDLQPGGRVRIRVSSTDFGQGTEMVLSQIVADGVGIPVTAVDFVQPDTALVPDSGPTVASRTVMIVGGVLERAARELARRLTDFAAAATGASVKLVDAQLSKEDGTPAGTFAEWADRFLAETGALEITERFEGDETTFDESTYRGTAYSAYGWACDVVEIEVDPDTLIVEPKKLTMVCDVGRAIHPVLCAGQVEGGTLQAIAWGYLEELKLSEGRYQNDRLQTYMIPTSRDVPEMKTVLVENPSPAGPFGAKGVGELPMDGGAPAIVQAIENATGIVPRDIPATPERLFADRNAGRIVRGASA